MLAPSVRVVYQPLIALTSFCMNDCCLTVRTGAGFCQAGTVRIMDSLAVYSERMLRFMMLSFACYVFIIHSASCMSSVFTLLYNHVRFVTKICMSRFVTIFYNVLQRYACQGLLQVVAPCYRWGDIRLLQSVTHAGPSTRKFHQF